MGKFINNCLAINYYLLYLLFLSPSLYDIKWIYPLSAQGSVCSAEIALNFTHFKKNSRDDKKAIQCRQEWFLRAIRIKNLRFWHRRDFPA